MDSIRLYLRLLAVSVRAQLEYPLSLALLTFGHLLITAVDFLVLWVLFDRFRLIGNWSVAQVGVFYGIVHLSFSIAEGIGRGFDAFDRLVRSGEFDVVLLRPRSAVLLVGGRELRLTRAGRFLQALAVLIWSLRELGLATSPGALLLAGWAVAGGSALFYGLFVLQATLAFWTVDSLEIVNTVTYGGVETAQYPLDIYPPWFRWFFTLVVPLGCVGFLPLAGLLRTGVGSPLAWMFPGAGFLFLAVAVRTWQFGVRHYTSTGS